MTISFLDVCRFIPTAGGTADFVVSSAALGYQTPAAANAVNGAIYRYRAESGDLSQWEVGYGAYSSGTATLARTTVLYSSNANAKVNFTNPPTVGIVYLAEDAVSAQNNLSDLASASTARMNLGLGSAATGNVGANALSVIGGNVNNAADSSTETNEKMAGYAVPFTPSKSGTLLIIFQGEFTNASAHEVDFEVHFGTGTAPAAGAAYTGTIITFSTATMATTSTIVPLTLAAVRAGFTLGTTYWFDISYGARGGGTTTVFNGTVTIVELATVT